MGVGERKVNYACATGVFLVSVTGARRFRWCAGRRYRNADPGRPAAGDPAEDVVMDGITSPIKADPEWAKLPLTVCQHCVKPTLSTPLWSLLVLCALHLPGVQRRYAGFQAANYWLPVDIYIGGIEHAICTCSTSASSTN